MSWACYTYGVKERCIQGFREETCWKEDYLENLGIDGRIILKWIFRKSDEESWTGLL
jgi:hypothetical protein